MSSGKRSIDSEENTNLKLNLKKVFLVLLIIILIVIIIFFIFNTPKKKEEKPNKVNTDVAMPEVQEVQKKTIDQILAEFGGEVTEQPRNDTYFVNKDGNDYTVYLDGEIVQGKIMPWSGNASQPQIDEAGNANVYNAEELKWIADQVISGQKNFGDVTITLRNNIDLGARQKEDGSWEGTPWVSIVGFLEETSKEENTQENQTEVDNSVTIQEANLKRFAGVFNGNGFSIRGMNIVSDKDYQGLFGFSSGTITNLKLKYSNVQGNNVIGAIVGLNAGTISNCSIEHVTVQGKEKIGGLVGVAMSESKIEFCSVVGDNCFVNADKYAGGLIGYTNNNANINNCTNLVNVNASEYVGGITGISFYGTKFQNVINSAKNIIGKKYVGGLIGYSQAEISYSNNHTLEDKNGIVKGEEYVGGLVGVNYQMGNITECFNSSPVVVEKTNGGGIAGMNNSNISSSYNIGDINSNNATKIGGICGQNSSESFIYSSYNIGKITSEEAGGIISSNFGEISNAFYLENCINNKTDSEYSKTEDEMKNSIISNLGEAFVKDEENINSGYPIFTWQNNKETQQ